MGHVKELDKLIDRKYFLIRRIDVGNSEDEEGENKEIESLNKEIAIITKRVLAEESEKLRTEIKEGTKKVFTDGNFKRTVARHLIEFLKPMYIDDEIRGIMRQGYKIMRGR